MARLDDLRQALLDAYAHMPEIGSMSIHVTFLEDAVALTGEVASLQAKEEAENLARQIVPGLAIDNSLVITGNRPADDAELTTRAQQALLDDGLEAGVEVRDGIALLRGNAGSLDARNRAHRVVARIPGIREVQDARAATALPRELGPDDIRLTNAVEERLANAMATPRADEIRARTQDGKVTLDGWVKSAEEAILAERLAQEVPGVRSVESRLVSTDGATGGDEALNQEIRRLLGKRGDMLSPVDVLSAVVKQEAFLWGEVDTPEQRLAAEALAQEVPGIVRVTNYLQVVNRRSRPQIPPRAD